MDDDEDVEITTLKVSALQETLTLPAYLTVILIYFYTPVVFCCFFFTIIIDRWIIRLWFMASSLFSLIYLVGDYKLVGKVFPWKRIKKKKKKQP